MQWAVSLSGTCLFGPSRLYAKGISWICGNVFSAAEYYETLRILFVYLTMWCVIYSLLIRDFA